MKSDSLSAIESNTGIFLRNFIISKLRKNREVSPIKNNCLYFRPTNMQRAVRMSRRLGFYKL